MSGPDRESLSALVNASGFAFQLALEHLLRNSPHHKWRVVSQEHPWRDEPSGREGFIDLVLQYGVATWVLECKRPRDGTWVFLAPQDQRNAVTRIRCLWVAGSAGRKAAGWDDIDHLPESPESSFCVIRGTGEGERTLLERLCSQLVAALDCLANEEIAPMKAKRQNYHGVYVPVIITTAALQVCRFDPSQVSLRDGTLDSATFESVRLVRFRKAFSPDPPPGASPTRLDEASRAKERTVLVINAEALIDTLANAKMQKGDYDEWPWTGALEGMASR